MDAIPARHVHLDFHTSEHIPGVGRKFDKKQFQAALKLGRVESINIFAKCHHGWSYYPTKAGLVHPTLRRDLLGEQIEACHEIGVRAPIYYTVGWSANDARLHPEWTIVRKDGSIPGLNPDAKPTDRKPEFQWVALCPSGGYREVMLAQTKELCERYDVDGFWYDICFVGPCWCDRCLAGMKAAGLDPESDRDAETYNVRKWRSFAAETTAIVHRRFPGATIFYNGGTRLYSPQWYDLLTHFELEDLPSSWGGYDKFPLRARYFAEKRKPIVAMSGKFHTNWGEFGGFKHPEAIRFEAACMIAYGARACFGDQLHPSGVMDRETYANIGHAYRYAEKIEAYGLEGACASRLGLWLSGNFDDDQGVANMLLESQMDFRVVGPESDLAEFDAVVLPGGVRMDAALAARFGEFLRRGGGLLALADSPLDPSGARFALDVGARYVGPARFEMDYLVAGSTLAKGLPATPFLNCVAGHRAQLAGARALAAIREPFFDRTYERYCGHQNAPFRDEDAPHPGAVAKKNVVWLAHPLGRIYHKNGARVHRDYFVNALRLVYRRPVLRAPMPSAGRATFIHQPARRRYVAHLLYGPPMPRGKYLVIEDLVPLRNVPIALRVPEKINRAHTVPDGKALRLTRASGETRVTVGEFSCHTAVVFEY